MVVFHVGALIKSGVRRIQAPLFYLGLLLLGLFLTASLIRGGEPHLVKDFTPGKGISYWPSGTMRSANINGTIYFTDFVSWSPWGNLWKTDGTTQGTVRVRTSLAFPGFP